MKLTQLLFFYSVALLLVSCSLQGAVIGSNTAVSREPFFVLSGQDNEIIGFAYLDGGFALQDNATTVTFNGLFPVRGEIALNNGTLYLNTDLQTDNLLTFSSLGNIISLTPGYRLILAPSLSVWGTPTSQESFFSNVDVILENDLTVSSPIRFSGSSIWDGAGHLVELAPTASIIVDNNSTLLLKDIRINHVADTNIRAVNSGGLLSLYNTTFLLDNNASFTIGQLQLLGDNVITGSFTYSYDSPQTSSIRHAASLLITGSAILSAGRNGGVEPLYFDDQTAKLAFEDATLSVKPTGFNLTRGTILADRDMILDIKSTSSLTGFIMGNGTPAGDAIFSMGPAAVVLQTGGSFVYNNTTPTGLKSASLSTRILRNALSRLHAVTDFTLANVTVQPTPPLVTTTSPNVLLRLSDAVVERPLFSIRTTSRQADAVTLAMEGNDFIALSRGSAVFALTVTGVNNTLTGEGSIAAPLSLLNSGAQLILGMNGSAQANIALNGGSIALITDLKLGNDIVLSGSGSVNLVNKLVEFGSNDLTWTGTTNWTGTNGTVRMRANVTLSGSWTFTNNCTINGRGFTLTLGPTGEIVVGNNSRLVIQDAVIHGIAGNNIRSLDNNSVIVLDNMTWQQSGDYTFTTGGLLFKNTVRMQPNDELVNFAYQTTRTSTVNVSSRLILDSNFTFSYDPIGGSKDLLVFTDQTSLLELHGGTLHVTSTGINLTNGTIRITQNSSIASEVIIPEEGPTIDNGITLGNNNILNDQRVFFAPGTNLTLTQGSINYRNVDLENSWRMGDNVTLLILNTGSRLNLYESLDVNPGSVIFGDATILGRVPGKDLFGSIVPLGSLFFVELTP